MFDHLAASCTKVKTFPQAAAQSGSFELRRHCFFTVGVYSDITAITLDGYLQQVSAVIT
jgi:hypothetical protein